MKMGWMIRFLAVGCVGLLLSVGCKAAELVMDPKQLTYIALPETVESEYFTVRSADFAIDAQQKPGTVQYQIVLQLRRPLLVPLYLVVQYDDPKRWGRLVQMVEMQPGSPEVTVTSEPVQGVKRGGHYRVMITSYNDPDHTHRVDHLVQHVHSNVDWYELHSAGLVQ